MSYTPKGLATIALLKTRLDQNQDHLGLFEPFVADALLHMPSSDFVAADVKAILQQRTGILVPTGAVQTLLNRFARQRMIHRAGGRYVFGTEPVPDPRLDETRAVEAANLTHLAEQFINFSAQESVGFPSTDEALIALATFISDNKVHLVLKTPLPDSPLSRSSQSRRMTRLIARFITHRCLASDDLRPAFESLVEGILVEDTLFLRDLDVASQRFRDLTVVLDTPILFAAIELTGTTNAVAASEGLHLLREAGARTVAFDRTVAEMRRILAVYERHLATAEGRLRLFQTDLTRHVLTAKMTPADIHVISSTLEQRLAKIGVSVRPLPPHDRRYTLDEQALAAPLRRPDDHDPDSPRVQHDVDCIAGVLTLRAGRSSASLERCNVVFATSSGPVVRTVQQWYFSQNETGIPPAIHQLALTSIAWLKKPAAAPDIKIHELAAICAAALRPTRETWSRVVETLKTLSSEGVITDDEIAAVVVSELIEPMLARLDDDVDPDADSIQEAIQRVQESYRQQANLQAQKTIDAAVDEAISARRAASEVIALAQAEAQVAREAATTAIEHSERVIALWRQRLSRFARWVANLPLVVGGVVLTMAALLSIPGMFDSVSGTLRVVAIAILIVSAGFGLLGAISGVSLLSLRNALQATIERRLASAWLQTSRGVGPPENIEAQSSAAPFTLPSPSVESPSTDPDASSPPTSVGRRE